MITRHRYGYILDGLNRFPRLLPAGFTQFANASSGDDQRYATWFRSNVVSSVGRPPLGPRSNVHLFSPNCVVHTFTYGPSWWQIKIKGYSSRDAIGQLAYRNTTTSSRVPRVLIDDCIGLSCSEGCPHPPVIRGTN